ncbi:LPS export ABC transporter periplasmic protein LptC [Snuella lapsa]|uniref:LPS export ABC transporter periplasmic protein LptC n=1 Tax=Snuella lapsa TaxID=870481 RepID=A0ABP6Y8F8_9FLAO
MKPHYIHSILNIVTVITVTMFFSCNNNLSDVSGLDISENEPIGVSYNTNTVYTDSGKVKAILISPKILNYSNRDFPFYEFPEGVVLDLFDDNNKKSVVVADYAINYLKADLIDLQGNVVIATQDNDTLYAEQLYYYQKKEWLFTNKPVTFRTGLYVINGNGFDSNSKLTNAEVLEINGFVTLDE